MVHGLRRAAAYLVGGAFDFIYPPLCLLCGGRATGAPPLLCAPCRAGLAGEGIDFRLALRNAAGGGEDALAGCAAGTFEGPLGRLVRAFKFESLPAVARLVGPGMTRVLLRSHLVRTEPLLLEVPTSAARRRERGFNPPELLAREVSRETGLAHGAGWLRRVRRTRAQATLPASRRWANVAGSMALAAGISVRGRSTLLVDDVCTTGATLAEAARAVRAGGGQVAGALVAARTLAGDG